MCVWGYIRWKNEKKKKENKKKKKNERKKEKGGLGGGGNTYVFDPSEYLPFTATSIVFHTVSLACSTTNYIWLQTAKTTTSQDVEAKDGGGEGEERPVVRGEV